MSTATSTQPPAAREDAAAPGFGELLLRRWPFVLLAIIAFGAVGAAYGSTRSPTYTAQAQLIVGPSASSPQALTGTADASVDIARSYAQLGNTEPTARAAAKRLDLPLDRLSGVVSVTAVNGNPLVRVQARSGVQREAVRIVAGYAGALRSAIDDQISPERLGRAQLRTYSDAAQALIEARSALRRLKADDDASRSDIEDATAKVNTAELEAQTAGNIYSQARQAAQAVTGLTPFDEARAIGDDSQDLLLRWAAIGVAAGAVIGFVLAGLLALRRRSVLSRAI